MTTPDPSTLSPARTARTPDAAPRGGVSRIERAVLVFGVMAMCVNLRPAVTGMPPIFGLLQSRLGLAPSEVTVLAALPVLCFGLFSAPAAIAARRWGEERALGVALVVGTAGLFARSALPGALLLPGTVVVSGAIAFMNVLLPSLIKRREPRRAGVVLSLYLVMLNAGAISASAVVVPVYRATHGSLFVTLGVTLLPMAAALLAWLPQLRFGAAHRAASRPPGAAHRLPRGHVRRYALAWQVTAFMGLQSLTYYATMSFLPALFVSRGMDTGQAGLVGSLLGAGGVLSAFGVPVIAHRSARLARLLICATVVLCGAGIAAALWAPVGAGLACMPLLGLGQGAGLALALYFVMARAADPAVAASLSALAQGVGYVVAALGPLAVGSLHTLTGGWLAPVLVLLAVTGVEFVVGLLAARPLHVPAPPRG